MCLDFSHGSPIIDLLAAGWTFMKLQSWDRVCLAMKLAGPLPPNLLNLVAAQVGHFVMLNIGRLSEGLLGRNEEVVGFRFDLRHQFTLRINQKSTEVRALNHIKTLS